MIGQVAHKTFGLFYTDIAHKDGHNSAQVATAKCAVLSEINAPRGEVRRSAYPFNNQCIVDVVKVPTKTLLRKASCARNPTKMKMSEEFYPCCGVR